MSDYEDDDDEYVDPDDSAIPACERMKEQTDKAPTGPFDRDKLLNYLETQAKSEVDWIERVPFEAGQKRGKAFIAKAPEQLSIDEADDIEIELDLEEDEDDENAEQNVVDLAGVLGIQSILKEKGITSPSKFGVIKSGLKRDVLPSEVSEKNETDVDDVLERLEADDPSLTQINLNNIKTISAEKISRLVEALSGSNYLLNLSIANVGVGDKELSRLYDALQNNSTLQSLNIESNRLSPEYLAHLLRATLTSQTLTEFHAENQMKTIFGNQIEMDMIETIDENESLLRVGLTFQSMEARQRVARALQRNYENVRLKRLKENQQS